MYAVSDLCLLPIGGGSAHASVSKEKDGLMLSLGGGGRWMVRKL